MAAFASWHESHGPAAAVLAKGPSLPGPTALETYAVLTRLPPPHRVPGTFVRDFMQRAFPGRPLTLPDDRVARLIEDLVRMDVEGGAAYDAVIGLIAVHHGGTLVTLDRRARATYQRLGVTTRFLEPGLP